jgi:hypothetical protein
MNANPEHTVARASQPRKRRLWHWFLAGFLIVFVGATLIVTMHTMHPQGHAVMECKLWKYYAIEIPRLFGPLNLGPAMDSSSAVVTVALQHLFVSALGGAVMLGVGWVVNRLRRA